MPRHAASEREVDQLTQDIEYLIGRFGTLERIPEEFGVSDHTLRQYYSRRTLPSRKVCQRVREYVLSLAIEQLPQWFEENLDRLLALQYQLGVLSTKTSYPDPTLDIEYAKLVADRNVLLLRVKQDIPSIGLEAINERKSLSKAEATSPIQRRRRNKNT